MGAKRGGGGTAFRPRTRELFFVMLANLVVLALEVVKRLPDDVKLVNL